MLLFAIAVAAFVSTLAGGLLALGLRDKLHLILGFSAGAVIGVAFFDLLPEAIDTARQFHSTAVILAWSALGFLAYLVLDRMLLIQARAAARERRRAGCCARTACSTASRSDSHSRPRTPSGIVVADRRAHARFLRRHQHDEHRAKQRRRAGAGACAGCSPTRPRRSPASPRRGSSTCPSDRFGPALALFGGFFLYIGASDLIPESYHAHPNSSPPR